MVITRKKISIHIYNVFYSTIKIKKTHALKIVDNILYLIKKTINIYGKIIINNFGSFRLKEAKEKIGKNFHNKQKLFIAKRKKIFFQTSHRLKEILNSKGIDIKQKNYSTKLSNKLKLNYETKTSQLSFLLLLTC
jgi:nucleoid DNA-binding protein